MSQQVGTLVGAPIRVNDSLDTYPSAIDNEIKGGLHSVNTAADMAAIPAERRSPGMLCYVFADGNIYQLANDLVTWSPYSSTAGGTTLPGSGGTSSLVSLLSGNFGVWTALSGLNSNIINSNFTPSFKGDLLAFPTRAIVYFQAQFGLNAAFAGTSILLGTLPASVTPAAAISKYFICQNIEMFLTIDTSGNVSLVSKDGFNLPTTSGTPETQPIYLDLFYQPTASTYTPTVYSYTRTQNFTRNNCGSGYGGSVVSYSQTYTSTVSLAAATAIALADSTYNTSGQAYANANGTCSVLPPVNYTFNNNNVTNTLVFDFSVDSTNYGYSNSINPGGNQLIPEPPATSTSTVKINVTSFSPSSVTLTKGIYSYMPNYLGGGLYEFLNVDLSVGGTCTINIS